MTPVELLPGRAPEEVERAAERAAEVLAAGGLIVHPTETVYGIGGDGSLASNRTIARVKGRDPLQPLILLTLDRASLQRFLPGIGWPSSADSLGCRFWPGPLTLVLPCAGAPPGLQGPDGGVAVRVTSNAVVSAILRRWGRPITSTSANRSGDRPPRTVEAALRVLAPELELECPVLAIDSGATSSEVASTVVSLVESPPRLLRQGPITAEQLKGVLADLGS